MKLIIDIDEKWEAKCSWFSDRDIMDYLYGVCRNGPPIPDNATNGDVMKAIFNCKTSNEDSNYLVKYSLDGIYEEVNSDWWNAPYQKGGK